MTCISPPELDDRQLWAYVDGEADWHIREHLARCESCRERAEQIARFHERLKSRIFRLECPQAIELGEYHLGLLDQEQATAISQHLMECPHCQREVAQLKGYLVELAPTIESSLLGRAKILIARLVGGEREDEARRPPTLAPAWAGIRGDARGPITLEADGILIVLDVQPAAEERVTLLGQIASDDPDRWTGASVELRQASQLQLTTSVDDLGAFRCEAFSPGPTEILITPVSGSPVLIPNVDIAI